MDLLLGADGIHSEVRRWCFGEAPARFTGQVAWRFLIPSKGLAPDLQARESQVWWETGEALCTLSRGRWRANQRRSGGGSTGVDRGVLGPPGPAEVLPLGLSGMAPRASAASRARNPRGAFPVGPFRSPASAQLAPGTESRFWEMPAIPPCLSSPRGRPWPSKTARPWPLPSCRPLP